ncbi:MAG: hypothetical protein C0448_12015 [Sphingobacteriaceae bacterium]|nr:hypothetical protein [Sphingobacteriaceae bacterium]
MDIKKYKASISNVQNEILSDIKNHLLSIDYTVTSKNTIIKKIETIEDFKSIPNIEGFYVIFSDFKTENNICTLKYNNTSAIYRGQSYDAKDRLKSHLINEEYVKTNPKYKRLFTTCMQIVKGTHGININYQPYNNSNWYVIVHRMEGSSEAIRELAEVAFDEIYNKPIFCRD